MYIDDEFERLFKRLSNSFFGIDDLFERAKNTETVPGPFYYGYTMTVGPDGRPLVREYGNAAPGLHPTLERPKPLVDTIVDEKEGAVKLVAEMPGVEKADVKIVVEEDTVNIDAERGDKKYHVQVPIEQKIDKDSAKASYKNGILEIVFRLDEPEKPKGRTLEVQ